MNTIVDDTLVRLSVYFSRENYNSMLKFETLQTSIGYVARLLSGTDTLFFIGFPNTELLEIFMLHIGEECMELGECLFITATCQDRDMVKNYWTLPIEGESSSDDSRLPELD